MHTKHNTKYAMGLAKLAATLHASGSTTRVHYLIAHKYSAQNSAASHFGKLPYWLGPLEDN